ncbi:MAG: glycoside hydrolase family 3 N-terminal domain-containing protein [Lacibacter sp.]
MRSILLGFILLLFATAGSAQSKMEKARIWADSVFQTLTKEQRIAQLMIIRAHSNLGPEHVERVAKLIRTYNIGGLCFFQGGPVRQAQLTNYYQQLAQTPLLISIDGEWGLGMRLDSVTPLPRQLMLGAVKDAELIYRYGNLVGRQCKRMGIHLNFAPVADINNNPNNPVINDRSFGEDPFKVALYAIQYMNGLQHAGVMACAKHFPGHGDTETDSHFNLPLIHHTRSRLDSLELYPFRQLIEARVASIMIAHLFIPSLDSTQNVASSLSSNVVTKLLRNELNFQGLAITDALEMKGVQNYFPNGMSSVMALRAGNDLLCLPDDIPSAIKKIKRAIRRGTIKRADLNQRVRNVLIAKYLYGLWDQQPVQIQNLTEDLNAQTTAFIQEIAQNAITLVRNDNQMLPVVPAAVSFLKRAKKQEIRIAYVAIGIKTDNFITRKMREELNADVFFFHYKQDAGNVRSLTEQIRNNYQQVFVGVHGYSRRPANNFGISAPAVQLAQSLLQFPKSALLLFGNPYATKYFSGAGSILACYEDHEMVQSVAFEIITGKRDPKGVLPVTVHTDLLYGTGQSYYGSRLLPQVQILDSSKTVVIDSIVNDAIRQKAFPGCTVLAVKNGTIVFEKAYGYHTYEPTNPVTPQSVFDVASITKICATTLALMKLYEEGKLDLQQTIGHYLPFVKGTPKANLVLKDLLLHQAGLKAWIPFYKETLDSSGTVLPGLYSGNSTDSFRIEVAKGLFLHAGWMDTLWNRILFSEPEISNRYIYSDLDFILLGKLVEQLTGLSLDAYVNQTFYQPLQFRSTFFKPRFHLPANLLVPTEQESKFRCQLLQGDVHDPAAAMFGGVSGHAGLFSSAYELAVIMQMLLNGGTIGSHTFFKKETVALFTSYQSSISRRGLGFDKPEKDNAVRKDPYPALSASPSTFGHTGFTGTSVWVDPANEFVFVFLSNRLYPDGGENKKIMNLNVRGKLQEAFYQLFMSSALQ